MGGIRINGIRVGHQMLYLCRNPLPQDVPALPLLYQALAEKRVNLPCLGVESTALGHAVSCCIEDNCTKDKDGFDEDGFNDDTVPVCIVSVYPHASNAQTLGFLLSLFKGNGIDFFHMVSSNAMISFVIRTEDKARILAMLETTFDLPSTHTPYEPGFHEETAAFVKKRYQETRAYFQETKIKTYGFSLEKGLDLVGMCCKKQSLTDCGPGAAGLSTRFYFATAFGHIPKKETTIYWLTRLDRDPCRLQLPFHTRVDMVYFHGPHFGDRFGIFNAAAFCLDHAGITLLLAGCTGASITLVTPEGQGEQAVQALRQGFDTP